MSKNVLVIAGSSQIGLEAVKLLLKSGFNVYLTSRSTVDLEHEHLYIINTALMYVQMILLMSFLTKFLR